MFKQELPLMYPDDADVQAVKEAMWDPFEYLMARKRDGLLKTDFSRPLGKVSYHVPCHSPRAEHRQEDRGDAQDGRPALICTPSSAARATPALSA